MTDIRCHLKDQDWKVDRTKGGPSIYEDSYGCTPYSSVKKDDVDEDRVSRQKGIWSGVTQNQHPSSCKDKTTRFVNLRQREKNCHNGVPCSTIETNMNVSETFSEADKVEKLRNSVTMESPHSDGRNASNSRLTREQELINKTDPAVLRKAQHPSRAGSVPEGSEGSPELARRMSRTETVRQDAIKLKTATLGRMGKIFKQRSQTPVPDKSSVDADGIVNATKSVENCAEDASRKEKTNSLGRMLKLVDKDGSPKKLFHSRAGSLSRILRKHPHNENNDVASKPSEDVTPGIFSRMFSQLRGRPHSGNTRADSRGKAQNKMSSLPPKVPQNSKTTANVSSLSSPSSSPMQSTRSDQKSNNLQYSI